MPKFVFAYHMAEDKKPKNQTPQEYAAMMAEWKEWFLYMGDAVVDGGAPVGKSKTVSSYGVADNGGSNPLGGYSIIQAETMEKALELAERSPMVTHGGSVEVAEFVILDM